MGHKHFVIIGGGTFGLSAALSLRGRGYQVTIFDRLPIPAEDAASTDVNKVVRADYGDDILYQQLGLAAIAKFKEWNESSLKKSGRVLYHECGVAFMTPTVEMNAFERSSLRNLGAIDTALLQPGDVGRKWPGLSDMGRSLPFGYVNFAGGYAESGNTIAFMADMAREAGIRFVTGDPQGVFCSYVEVDGVVAGIRTADGVSHMGNVILAAGSWSPSLCSEVGQICVATGQPVIQFKLPADIRKRFEEGDFPVWFADISQTGFYGFPVNFEGILKVANHGKGYPSQKKNNGTVSVTPSAIPLAALLEYRIFLEKNFPQLNDFDIYKTRLCWYCDSIDGNFLIDFVDGRQGLFVATGGSGHAFKFAPVIGDVIADIVEGKASPFKDLLKWRSGSDKQKADVLRAELSTMHSNGQLLMTEAEDLQAAAFRTGKLHRKLKQGTMGKL